MRRDAVNLRKIEKLTILTAPGKFKPGLVSAFINRFASGQVR
jgi:hypothetical protein